MNCTKCGKEIPEGENKICEDCQKALVNEIAATNEAEVKEEVVNEKKAKKAKKEKQPSKVLAKIKDFITKNLKLIIIALVVVLAIIGISNISVSSKVGNTIGNIRNYGYATKDGNWLYFLSPNADSTKVGIFKMKEGDKNQKSKKELVMDSWDVLSLNVSGKYIYFIGILPDAFNENDDVNNKIYRMKKDGSDLTVINDNEFDNDCYEIYVIKDKVYYIGTDYNVYKMNSDGSKREKVLDNQTGYLGITDKYIIYNAENTEQADYVTYIADIDGQNARPIIENTRLYSVNIIGDYVYYTNESKQICRVKIDGGESELLYDTTAYNMNASGKYIYYLNYADEANSDYTVCLYRVKANGSTKVPENIKALETYSSFIDVVGDWIIYMDSNEEEGFINLVKTNGKKEIKVYSLNYNEYYTSVEDTATETGDTVVESTTDEEVPNSEDVNTEGSNSAAAASGTAGTANSASAATNAPEESEAAENTVTEESSTTTVEEDVNTVEE